jgi:3',5'-cyclic AMP phosphodiesterase CpdA
VSDDGIDRRGFLGCMAWAGTAVVISACGGEMRSRGVGAAGAAAPRADFTFVQISDSHIGFDHAPNTDVTGTYEQAVARINALPQRPAFIVHTGDHVHLSTAGEFDTVKQITSTIKTDRTFHVPGEHDVFVDGGRLYRRFFGRGSHGSGYYSFDYKGVHFLALANVQASESETNAAANGLGRLGAEQIAWVKRDLRHLSSDTPLVVFGHVPLLAVYPQWGWATADSAQVLALVRRFSSVTVLNGHIHQVLAKREGRITMHTADSTAFPQHHPGVVAPGPYPLPAGELPSRLGIRTVDFVRGRSRLALTDETLAS